MNQRNTSTGLITCSLATACRLVSFNSFALHSIEVLPVLRLELTEAVNGEQIFLFVFNIGGYEWDFFMTPNSPQYNFLNTCFGGTQAENSSCAKWSIRTRDQSAQYCLVLLLFSGNALQTNHTHLFPSVQSLRMHKTE